MSQTFIFMGLLGWFVSVAVAYTVLVRNSPDGKKPSYLLAIRMNIIKEIRERNGIGIAASFFQLYFLYLFLMGIGASMLGDQLGPNAFGGFTFLVITLLPLAIGAFIIGQVIK